MQLTVPAARVCRIFAAVLLPLSFITPVSASYLSGYASSYIHDVDLGLVTERVSFDSTNGYQAGDTIQSLVSLAADLSLARARADYGTLGLFTEANAASTLTALGVKSEAQAIWNDTITIGGAAPGANVRLLATIVLDVGQLDSTAFGTGITAYNLIQMTTSFGTSRNWCGTSAAGHSADQANDYCERIEFDYQVGVGRNEFSFVVETTVGAHEWGAQMSLTSLISGVNTPPEVGSGYAIGDAFNTAHSYFTVLTPGATMQWESGHDYSLPPVQGVPEPSTHALMVAALGALGFAARRRRRH